MNGSHKHQEKCELLLADLPKNFDVLWLGLIEPSNRCDFLASCDLIVVPSKFESFSLALIEALLHCGMVAATPRQGALEYVKNEPGCFISQGNNAVNLASAIVSALDVGKVANLESSNTFDEFEEMFQTRPTREFARLITENDAAKLKRLAFIHERNVHGIKDFLFL